MLLEHAAEFHTHLGPFLVLGLRAGLAALRVLSTRHGDPELSVEVDLPYRVPMSCLLDGIQFSTGCTAGNKRLTFRDSTEIVATFRRRDTMVRITVTEKTRKLLLPLFLGERLDERELHKLAHGLADLDEKSLLITNQIPGSQTRG